MKKQPDPGGIRTSGYTRKLVVALITAAALTLAAHGHAGAATRCNDNWNLHAATATQKASCGERVDDLQWMLGGHKPNAFTKVKPTFRFKPNGAYGARTKAAVLAYKYRIGYPKKGECGQLKTSLLVDDTGPQFFEILKTGHRPACWITLAASRLKAVEPGVTTAALKIRAWETTQLGVTERPAGSNRGPRISYSIGSTPSYQSFTSQYGTAWCVSFQQAASAISGFGTFADHTAGVYYALDYYAARNLVFAKPKVGALVAFVTYTSRGYRKQGTGHMGFVVKITAAGFASIEGNHSNGVHEVFHEWRDTGSRWSAMAFIYRPGIA